MSIILFIIVVLVVLCLVCYAVNLLPLPGPPPIKSIIMALCVVVAALVIVERAGLLR